MLKKECFRILMAVTLGFGQVSKAETYVIEPSRSECTPLRTKALYKIKPGDTLGGVLHKFNIGPLWGPQRFVDKTASSNQIPSQKTLRVNDTIVLPLHCKSELDKFVTEEKGGNIFVIALKSEVPRTVSSTVGEGIEVVSTAAVASPDKPAPVAPVTTAIPRAAPMAVLVTAPASSFNDYSTIGIDVVGEYSALTGVDKGNSTTGRLLSKMDPGVRLSWAQQWDAEMRSEVYFSLLNVSYQPEKSGVSLKNNGFSKTAFGAAMFFKQGQRFEWGLGFSQGTETFYRGSGVGSGLEFDAIPLFRLQPKLNYLLIQRSHLSLSAQAGASWISGGSYENYSVSSGMGADLALLLKHEMTGGNDLHCRAYFEIRRQNTSLLELDEKATGLNCGLGWRLP